MAANRIYNYSANDRIYIYHDSEDLAYNAANEHCENFHSGSLAILDNENSFQDIFNGFNLSNWKSSFFYSVGLSKQNGSSKWIDGSNFSGYRNIASSHGKNKTCVDYALSFKEHPATAKFHGVECCFPQRYVCEKRFRKPEASASSNPALLAGCLYAACVILALVALVIFWLARKKKGRIPRRNPAQRLIPYLCRI